MLASSGAIDDKAHSLERISDQPQIGSQVGSAQKK